MGEGEPTPAGDDPDVGAFGVELFGVDVFGVELLGVDVFGDCIIWSNIISMS